MGSCLSLCTRKIIVLVPENDTTDENITRHRTHFPKHERKSSAIYRKTHKQMKHMPCFICGKTNEKDNIHVETHHFYIEKAAENAIDWKVFGDFADKCYNIQTGESLAKFDWDEVAKNPDLFVDSQQNMIVLCKQHHTSGSFGIHHVPFPDWILQKFPKDGFQFLSDAKSEATRSEATGDAKQKATQSEVTQSVHHLVHT
jgi:hypothetical protein